MKKGTRITYRAKGRNPDGDNRINLADKRMITEDELRQAFKDPKMVFMKVTDHEVFGVNKLKFNGKHFLFLEANPVTFYFSLAYDVVHQLDDAKDTLERVLVAASPDNGHGKAVAFSYIFKVGSVGVIFSFLALEAFLNQQLPDHTTFEYQGKMVSKEIIERRARFSEKINDIIPKLDGRNFCQSYPRKGKILEKLKHLRDELTHLKQKRKDGITVYDDIYQEMLLLDLRKIVSTVKSFINFYQPGTIQNTKTHVKMT